MELSEIYVFGYNGFEQILQRSDMRILMTPMKFDISLMKRENCSSTISPTRHRAHDKCHVHVRRNSGTTFPRETADNCGVRETHPDLVAVDEGHSGSEDDSRNSSHKLTGQVQMRWNASIFSSAGFKLGCVNGEKGKFIDLSNYLGDMVSSPPRKLWLHEDKLYCISDSGDCFVRECIDDTAIKVDKVLLECSSSSNEVLQTEGRQATKKEGESEMERGCELQSEDFPTSAVLNLQEVSDASPDNKNKERSLAGFTNISAGDLHVLATIGPENRPGKITRHEDRAYVFHPFHQPVEVQDIACGKEHALLLTAQGLVYSYGMGSRGQLGHGDVGREDEPKLLEAIACVPMVTLSAGGWHSACVSAIGDIYIWGWNESGQLGLPPDPDNTGFGRAQEDNSQTACQVTFQTVPAILDLPGGVNVLQVSCGSRHTAAVTYDKRLYTWGWGKYGQLGHGDVQSREAPKLVDFFHQNRLDVLDVTCGDWSTAIYTSRSPEPMPR